MKYTPHPYQAYCESRIVDTPALALWLEMGLGKTAIVLSAINELKYNRFEICRALVIAPKKVAEATWQHEAQKWDHLKHLRFSTVLGSTAQRIRAVNTPADVYVINRDNVCWLVDYYRNAWPFDMVILDEATSFKSQQAKRWKALKAIRPHIGRIVELTGTPSPQSLLDLWPQIFLLDQGQRLGKSIGQFRERYFNPDKRNATTVFTYKPKDGTEQAIQNLIGDICISMRSEDYLDLPDLLTDVTPVVLDARADRLYRQLEKEALLQVEEDVINAGTAAVLTNKLLQLCDGAVYTDEHDVLEVHNCKLEAFLELVEELGDEHALVFYNFQHDRDRLQRALEKSGLRVRVYTGPADEQDWNAGKIDILLAHPASCAYGLNLQQGGRHVIWFGLNWSLELYQQANKRLHRQGQEKPVIVHHLVVQGGMDEDVMKALYEKTDTQNALMDALKARITKAKNQKQEKGRRT
ncbi:DEAD/DEAH box helicase [Anaeromassilibacillus senegalensis]|uniref:DEAD/DEAH box helicase n=1 Tax=Anaeromassilibacillus senegalensis TaxID=1673717 RepID=A0ABS9CL16_9FIRM|nr:DEAD/DEAH box helicase [Anaeromassilibacillus senegalensis]MCF2651831.1 DEAD/DEAH box helicase [Anaeromassilibacillus senegalensis]